MVHVEINLDSQNGGVYFAGETVSGDPNTRNFKFTRTESCLLMQGTFKLICSRVQSFEVSFIIFNANAQILKPISGPKLFLASQGH